MSDLFTDKVSVYGPRLMTDLDLEDFQAAGVFGNVGHECGGFKLLQEIKPTVAGSRGGYGWMQWTGPRRRKYEASCKARQVDPASDEANYNYLVMETTGAEKASLAALRDTTTLAEATKVFCLKNLRPGVPALAARQKWAVKALAAMGGGQAVVTVAGAPNLTPFEIEMIQRRLKALHYDPGKIDRVWGPHTEGQVSAFRYAAGLPKGGWDDAAKAALFADNAAPLPVSDERANATAVSIADTSPIVQKTFSLQNATKGIMGVAAVGPVGFGVLGQVSAAKEKLQPVMDAFTSVPSWAWGVGIIAVAYGIYREVTGIQDARVAMHKNAETA